MPVDPSDFDSIDGRPDPSYAIRWWHGGKRFSLPIHSFEGEERIGAPFWFRLRALAPAEPVALSALIGAEAELSWRLADRSLRCTYGEITAAHVEEVVLDEGAASFVEILLGPPVGDACRNRQSACYADASIGEAIERTLSRPGGAGFAVGAEPAAEGFARDLALRVVRTDLLEAERKLTVQYEESDFDFVSRKLEALGLAYHFEHEPGVCRLVVTDSDDVRDRLAETLYPPLSLDATAGERRLLSLRAGSRAVPSLLRGASCAASLRDFSSAVDHRMIAGCFERLGGAAADDESRFTDAGAFEGSGASLERLAEIGRARVESAASVWHLTAAHRGLRVGSAVVVERPASVAEQDASSPLVLVALRHRLVPALGYRVEVEAVPARAGAGYVPPIRAAAPAIAGLLPALAFRFERELAPAAMVQMPFGGEATVRLLLPAQAPNELSYVTPREAIVLLGFIGGDPERPIVVGQPLDPNEQCNDLKNNSAVLLTGRGDQIKLARMPGDTSEMELSGGLTRTVWGSDTKTVEGAVAVTANEVKTDAWSIESRATAITHAGERVMLTAGQSVTLTASRIVLDAALVRVVGALRCETLIADTVVSSTYTPGAGNVW